MLNLNRIRESRGIQNVSNRKPLSDLISESYELLYNCESPKLRTLLEAHIKDIRENPNERTYLNNNLNTLRKLIESEGISDPRVEVSGDTDLDIDTEMKEITDIEVKDPEEDETQSRDEKTENAVDTSTTDVVRESRHASKEQFRVFCENANGKIFQKNLRKVTSMNESTNKFDLKESLSLYKAANSLMTQMAIELEHNQQFNETFAVCSSVLGKTLTALRESIISQESIPASVVESLSKFSKALREDDEIDDFIDWVDSEYEEDLPAEDETADGEEAPVEDEECPVENLINAIADEEVPAEAVTDVVDAVVSDEEVATDSPVEDQVQELSEEEKEDIKKYLCILRGCEEDSEEADAEPTEEELDALEERLTLRRANECGDPVSLRMRKKEKGEESKKVEESAAPRSLKSKKGK